MPTYDEFVNFVDEVSEEVGWTEAMRDVLVWQCGEGFGR
jgi:hypothetical protein